MEKTVTCRECGDKFVITDGEQKWYTEKGYSEPKRCKSCRSLRRQNIIGREDIDYGKKK